MKYKADTMKEADEAAELQTHEYAGEAASRLGGSVPQGRPPELADKEEAEIKVIEEYMPQAPTEEEVGRRRLKRRWPRPGPVRSSRWAW